MSRVFFFGLQVAILRLKLNLQGKFRLINKKLGTKLQLLLRERLRLVSPPPEATPGGKWKENI